MRLAICAVGRARRGPERDLTDDYLDRLNRTGRPLSLGPATISEVEDRKGGGMAAEAGLLARAVPDGALICALDERGRTMTSPQLARSIANWRDQGQPAVAFLIGGADGLDPGLRARADVALSLGAMVWPHMLVRVMLAEQLYRAATILAGTPYHRA